MEDQKQPDQTGETLENTPILQDGPLFAGGATDNPAESFDAPLPLGKNASDAKHDGMGQYIGPDGADESGGDDDTYERITGQNVVP